VSAIDEEYGPPWTFESAITAPDGIEVRVSITVPVRALWNGSSQRVTTTDAMPPIAQMAAADAMKQIDNAKNEVPF
jgi:hypothetical protein